MNTEEKVINALCRNKDTSVLLSENIDELFVTHGDVWKGVKSYYDKYRHIPDISVLQERYGYLESADLTAPTAHYLDSLKDEFLKSRMQTIMLKAAEASQVEGAGAVIEKLQASLARLNKFTNNVRDLDITDYAEAETHFAKVREHSLRMGGSPGIPTGFPSIDSAYTTGMAPGHLIIAIGWPGKGKTWFTGKLAINAWDQGFHPMIVSLEMSPENMRERLYTMMGEGQFLNTDLQRGMIDIDDFRGWGKRRMENKTPFTIISNEGVAEMTPAMVQAKIDQHKPDLLILDYHQLFMDNGKSQGDTARAKNLSREFKALAMSNNIPVVDITAATQEEVSDRDNPPMMSQVAWSKAIEYDADMAFAVHRFEDSGLVEVVCRKNRHGDLFDFWLEADINRGIWKESHGL